jgi:hypothetical protein
MCVTNRALPYSMSNDILRIVLCRGFGEACRVSSKGESEGTCDRLFQDLQNC